MNISHATTILVIDDNCKSQYKSAKHFRHLQVLANEKEKQVLRVWSNAGHEKGEVDHLGGVAKIFVKRAVSNYYLFDKRSNYYLFDKRSDDVLFA